MIQGYCCHVVSFAFLFYFEIKWINPDDVSNFAQACKVRNWMFNSIYKDRSGLYVMWENWFTFSFINENDADVSCNPWDNFQDKWPSTWHHKNRLLLYKNIHFIFGQILWRFCLQYLDTSIVNTDNPLYRAREDIFIHCCLCVGSLLDSQERSAESGYVSDETAFRYAVENINYHQLFNRSRLSPHYEKIPAEDSFLAANRGISWEYF